MSGADRERQAHQFLERHRRSGGDWEGAFSAWSVSKDLQPGDARAIRRIVQAELIGSCDAVITDLEYEPPIMNAPEVFGISDIGESARSDAEWSQNPTPVAIADGFNTRERP